MNEGNSFIVVEQPNGIRYFTGKGAHIPQEAGWKIITPIEGVSLQSARELASATALRGLINHEQTIGMTVKDIRRDPGFIREILHG